jgi:hypothetical protein
MLSDVIVTGAFTLAAALGGVALAQRHAAREAHLARAEARRGEQRRVLSELLVAGRDKVSRYQLMIPALHKFTDRDATEWVNTDSAKELGRVNAEMSRAIVQASLLVGDSAILRAILQIRQLDIEFSDKAVGPAWDKDLGLEGVLQGLRHVSALSRALTDLELAAGPLLRTPLTLPEPWPVRVRRWISLRAKRLLRRN